MNSELPDMPPIRNESQSGQTLPAELLEWARQQFSDEEIAAGLREVQETGGLELQDFIEELEKLATPNG
jgi:hypothetical protein